MKRLLDGLTLVAAVSAMIMAWIFFTGRDATLVRQEGGWEVDDWGEVANGGRTLTDAGAAQATLVEFGDYECPACRMYEPWLRGLRAEFEGQLEIRFRHYPLSYHRSAYAAARAAECAGAQGYFASFHEALLDDDRWMSNAREEFTVIAEQLALPDVSGFEDCVRDSIPSPNVERDRELGGRIGISGTPTLILNGIVLGHLDSLGLAQAVREALEEGSGR